ncbi:MAG: hypothetical protein K2K93_00580 [Muribaculaceae bacterium]|nr:hypothetical protein [Muribaculaceae bacterium]
MIKDVIIRKALSAFFLLIAGLIFTECVKDEPHSLGNLRNHFFTAYLRTQTIRISSPKDQTVKFYFLGRSITSYSSNSEFEELANFYGDINYNGPVFDVTGPCEIIDGALSGMKVRTISDFDNEHPAGSDVSDITECAFCSYKPFFENGYKLPDNFYTNTDYDLNEGLFGTILKYKVTEINRQNTIFSDPEEWRLMFTKQPARAGEYEFILTVDGDYGTMNGVFTIDFSSPSEEHNRKFNLINK